MNKCYIFAYSKEKINIEIEEDSCCICADAGYLTAPRCDLAIGDFDSMDVNNLPENIERKILSTKKDETDTMAALQEAIKRGYKDITIVGGVSGDIAHTYANITLLKYANEHGANANIISETCEIYYIKNSMLELKNKVGRRISVFAYSEKAEGVNLKGFEYELENATLNNGNPIGVSNMVTADISIIALKNGEVIAILDNIC